MPTLSALDFKASPTAAAPRPFAKTGSRAGGKAEKFILNMESLQHGTILAAGQWAVRGCCTKKPGDKTCRDEPRPGQIELAMYPRKVVKKGKVVPLAGPALRFCAGFNKGYVLPVVDPREAQSIARDFQACVAGDAAKTEACAKQFAGENAILADLGGPFGSPGRISSRRVRNGRSTTRALSAAGSTGASEYLADAERFLKEGSCGLALHHYADAREAFGKSGGSAKKLDLFEKRLVRACVVKRRGKKRRARR